MDRFLDTLNKLQDVFTKSGVSIQHIDLPQIVVLGSQSTGKSSVLESLARQNFLPRGMGIVTRRPLVLQMIHEHKPLELNGTQYKTWANFLHLEDKIITSMADVQKEIIDDTNRICGANRGISGDAIHLKLHSTEIPSLTLVDLPGLTKIPVGDQPKDIDRQIEKLVRSYIEKENSVILAVHAGNVDIANSESIKLATEVDPTGHRTLAVITKVDLMERNQESVDLLEGSTIDMHLGIIGVVNRSNKMLQSNVPIDEVLELEKNHFEDRYPLLSDRMGTPYLSDRLCDILIEHLKKCLPILCEKISEQVHVHREILAKMGAETTDKRHLMLSLISEFCVAIKDSIYGQLTYKASDGAEKENVVPLTKITPYKGKRNPVKDVPVKITSAGSELLEVFEKDCVIKLSAIEADHKLGDLKEHIRGSVGIQPALFVADGIFTTLIKQQLHLFSNPAIDAINVSHKCIERVISHIGKHVLSKYPSFEAAVVGLGKEFLEEQVPKAHNFISEYLKMEYAYINTNHPLFIERYEIAAKLFGPPKEDGQNNNNNNNNNKKDRRYSSVAAELQKKHERTGPNEERLDKEAELMHMLILQYFDIIRDHLIDVLPKTVMGYLVVHLTENLQSYLIKKLYTEETIASLLNESRVITKKRATSKKMMEVLTQAERLVAEIRISNRSVKELI